MTNTSLWESLEKTDPNYTKDFSGKGGFSGTAINAAYILKRLTETFGPCGRGWRFVVESERVDEGHTLSGGVDKCKIHVVRGHLEYMQDGMWFSTGPQFGQTTFVGENKYGPFTDEDAPKKSITDCIGKCAGLLGIGADVYMGDFDDNKYVNGHDDRAPARDISKDKPKPAKPTDAQAKAAAIEWAISAKKDLESITIREQLTAWKASKKGWVDKLKLYDEDHYNIIVMAIADAEKRVT